MNLIGRLREIAERWPAREALRSDKNSVTYQQLMRNALATAARLRASGAVEGAPVGICAERTSATVTLMLGCLFAGSPFVMVDPEAPRQRTARMLEDSGISLLVFLSRNQLFRELSATGSVLTAVLDMTAGGEALQEAPKSDLLAYLIFTSGSTGRPKATAIRQSSVVALVDALHQDTYPHGNRALNIAMVASFEFDPSIQQVFGALLGGHCLHIVPSRARSDGAELIDFLNRRQIDLCDGVPTHLRLMNLAASEHALDGRERTFLIGGEELTVETATTFLERFGPHVRLINLYGVAECCVDSVFHEVSLINVRNQPVVPLGRPLAGSVVEVVDERLQRVEPGIVGEILIGGTGVGMGYVNRPDLTRTRFVAAPHLGTGTFYRTGDMGQKLLDGTLRFCGRKDRQVKIGGHRVELGEIEGVAQSLLMRPASNAGRATQRCTQCVLDDTVPNVVVEDGLCNVCRGFISKREQILRYFGEPADFHEIVRRAKSGRSDAPDVMLLFSGGKDSTYVLLELVKAGYKVLTYTFDNGHLSPQAFANIKRITDYFGVEHVYGRARDMARVFRESLLTDSTVCTGCFRGISHTSAALAVERGINVVVTGLSRGQIFDTKLRPLIKSGIFDPNEIDRRLTLYRKMYERRRDETAAAVGHFYDTSKLDDIQFLDYFRFDPASVAQVQSTLAAHGDLWRQPKDTGLCSTNCQANDVGIWVHQRDRGYHNYAEPLSWDVRLGVVTRDDALKDLRPISDSRSVMTMLAELGMSDSRHPLVDDVAVVAQNHEKLGTRLTLIAAPCPSARRVNLEGRIRRHLAEHMPAYMVPSRIVLVDSMKRLPSGKIDYGTLNGLAEVKGPEEGMLEGMSPLEGIIGEVWSDILGVSPLGPMHDFFEAGGDSLAATIVAASLSERFGSEVEPLELFETPTIRGQADMLVAKGVVAGQRMDMPVPAASEADAAAADAKREVVLMRPLLGSADFYEPLIRGILKGDLRLGLLDPFQSGGLGTLRRQLAEKVNGVSAVVGWSYAALWAAHAAADATGSGRPLPALLLDPPPLSVTWWRSKLQELAHGGNSVPQSEASEDSKALLSRMLRDDPTRLLDAIKRLGPPWSFAYDLLATRTGGQLEQSLRQIIGAAQLVEELPEVPASTCSGVALFTSTALKDLFGDTLPAGWVFAMDVVGDCDHWGIARSAAADAALQRMLGAAQESSRGKS